jgi:hypothetical protein
MDKWIGIVKLNRERETLNFVKHEKDNAANVSFFPSKPISRLQGRLDEELKGLSVASGRDILKSEETAL